MPRSKPTQWKNRPGELAIEIYKDDAGNVRDAHTEAILSSFLQFLVPASDDPAEIVISFVSSGYYDPQTYSHPEGYEDERTLERATLYIGQGDGMAAAVLTDEHAQSLFDLYLDQIMEVEIDQHPPEREYERPC